MILAMMFIPQTIASIFYPESIEGVGWIQSCLAGIIISFISLCFIFILVVCVIAGQSLVEKMKVRILGN